MRIEIFFLAIVLSTAVQSTSRAATFSEEDMAAMARVCAPAVGADVLAAIARVEGHFDPLAVRNNSKHLSATFSSLAASSRQAEKWISEGDSVDLGLMQINSSNLTALGLTVETALDPCRSLHAGAHVLLAAYEHGSTAANRQAALLIALSRYNTGRSLAGLANGYVGQVLAAEDEWTKPTSKLPKGAKQQLPVWDIWGRAAVARDDGAAWLVGSQDTKDFLIGAGAPSSIGEPHALSQGSGTVPNS